GDSMDDDHPLFSTFKPIGEDTASTKPGPGTTPVRHWGAEQPLGHHHTHGRVGHGAVRRLSPTAPHPSTPELWGPQLVALRAQTRLWFEQTQAQRLGAEGKLPPWFHGFISRRETEKLLQDQPPGCFLVRFSESTVGFVLSYRGRDRCRHFVLDQLWDGRYVILGEPSAHAELADLLRHYAGAPVTPYHEFLTTPRQRVRTQPPPRELPGVGSQRHHAASQIAARNQATGSTPEVGPVSSSVCTCAVPLQPPVPLQPADAKYQQLMCFHTYAEPHEGIAPGSPSHSEPEDPIPFYAMGRGSSHSTQENIYSEV
ncbi:SH22A protein, partial [Chordeiles acutipennis]|nr:SH22A protein [Chordeiles acutipennis]